MATDKFGSPFFYAGTGDGSVPSAPVPVLERANVPVVPIEPVADVWDAQWVLERLAPFNTYSACSVVPQGFARYARIFYPGRRRRGGRRREEPVRWAEMDRRTGRRAHALMQWDSIAEPGVEAPEEGRVPPVVFRPLRAILASHTACRGVWLAVWRGWGWDYEDFIPDTKFIATPQREWDLFRAPLEHMDMRFDKQFFAWEQEEERGFTANMVWPDDRSWHLAVEIDHDTAYIGGSAPLIEALLASDDLEVWPAEPDDRI